MSEQLTTTLANNEFHLALTMAGAISAGCYTAGVIDHLFEILDNWEKAKDGLLPELLPYKDLIPRHKVIIDAMGGASAGGMTTTMAAIYALSGNIQPVKDPNGDPFSNNLLYRNWVIMDDDQNGTTFNKLWQVSDLQNGDLKSVLNSNFVDRIADRVFQNKLELNIKAQVDKLPNYINKDLQLVLSHCLLRGMPLEVSFETPIGGHGRKSVLPNHTTFEHNIISHFHLNKGIAPSSDAYLFLNPYDVAYNKTLKLCTVATGAFPVGLEYRRFDAANFSEEYVDSVMKRLITGDFGLDDPDPDKLITLKYLPKPFKSLTIDGGAVNNEPYREVLSILKSKYGETKFGEYPAYGVVMIDPFPDQAVKQKEYEEPKDLIGVIPEILQTLQDQSRVKRRELLESDAANNFRSIIFPRRWIKTKRTTKKGEQDGVKPDPDPICCASVGAFGGFFDQQFRHHDFFLGRDNARNFFRYFFSMPYDEDTGTMHPIHQSWSSEMRETFKITKEGKTFLPIIPDVTLLLSDQTKDTLQYSYSVPEKPKFDPEVLFSQRKAIQDRVLYISEIIKKRTQVKSDIIPPHKRADNNVTDWMKKYYHISLWQRLASWFAGKLVNAAFKLARRSLARKITEMIIKASLTDLEKKGLLLKRNTK